MVAAKKVQTPGNMILVQQNGRRQCITVHTHLASIAVAASFRAAERNTAHDVASSGSGIGSGSPSNGFCGSPRSRLGNWPGRGTARHTFNLFGGVSYPMR